MKIPLFPLVATKRGDQKCFRHRSGSKVKGSKNAFTESARWDIDSDPNQRESGRSETLSAAELLAAARREEQTKLFFYTKNKKKRRRQRLAACATFDPRRVAPPTTGTPL